MIVDAAFDSVGLNYFNTVVPKVVEFEDKFVKTGKIQNLKELSELPFQEIKSIWGNKRSWNVVNEVALYYSSVAEKEGTSDKEAFRKWAENSDLENWREDPIAKIRGVGLTTYQYLRMMAGIDTVMPDKIVKRVIKEVLRESNVVMTFENDIDFVSTVDQISSKTGYRPIEICWMTWLVQSEGDKIRMEKYEKVLDRI